MDKEAQEMDKASFKDALALDQLNPEQKRVI